MFIIVWKNQSCNLNFKKENSGTYMGLKLCIQERKSNIGGYLTKKESINFKKLVFFSFGKEANINKGLFGNWAFIDKGIF